MHKGFNLKIKESFFKDLDYQYGFPTYSSNKTTIKKDIQDYMNEDGSLDGDKISKAWFPEIKADIFISHSHSDEKLAIKLAGWLYKQLGLVSFIDSCVWGYAGDLLLDIDKKYCYDSDTGNYRYIDRNFSTSHVHMMLSTALMSMINKAECVIFLNTENSIQTADEVIKNTTNSPWIFSEIETTKFIQKRPVGDYRPEKIEKRALTESYAQKDILTISYRGDTSHLTGLSHESLLDWQLKCLEFQNSHPLDLLYRMTK